MEIWAFQIFHEVPPFSGLARPYKRYTILQVSLSSILVVANSSIFLPLPQLLNQTKKLKIRTYHGGGRKPVAIALDVTRKIESKSKLNAEKMATKSEILSTSE